MTEYRVGDIVKYNKSKATRHYWTLTNGNEYMVTHTARGVSGQLIAVQRHKSDVGGPAKGQFFKASVFDLVLTSSGLVPDKDVTSETDQKKPNPEVYLLVNSGGQIVSRVADDEQLASGVDRLLRNDANAKFHLYQLIATASVVELPVHWE